MIDGQRGWLHLEGAFVCSSRRRQGKLRRPGRGQSVSGKREEEGLLMRRSLSCWQHCRRGAQCRAARQYRERRLPRKRSRGASDQTLRKRRSVSRGAAVQVTTPAKKTQQRSVKPKISSNTKHRNCTELMDITRALIREEPNGSNVVRISL